MPEYEIKPQQDERNAQHLPHVDRHGVLELYLTFFEKLDEETEYIQTMMPKNRK